MYQTFKAVTASGSHTIDATCEETARLDLEEQGLGPIHSIEPSGGDGNGDA